MNALIYPWMPRELYVELSQGLLQLIEESGDETLLANALHLKSQVEDKETARREEIGKRMSPLSPKEIKESRKAYEKYVSEIEENQKVVSVLYAQLRDNIYGLVGDWTNGGLGHIGVTDEQSSELVDIIFEAIGKDPGWVCDECGKLFSERDDEGPIVYCFDCEDKIGRGE